MDTLSNTPSTPQPSAIECPRCAHFHPRHEACLDAVAPAPTVRLSRPPSLLAAGDRARGNSRFTPTMHVMLQFLPSGSCRSLPLRVPLVLGRGLPPGKENALDLAELSAYQHGVSRQHCVLQRRDSRLFITDLGSLNGTRLNGKRLFPHQAYEICDGDHLILGTLHVLVFFCSASWE